MGLRQVGMRPQEPEVKVEEEANDQFVVSLKRVYENKLNSYRHLEYMFCKFTKTFK